jgi:hypothetical protein
MANTIRIKRSTATSTPTTLQNAELAYSELSDKLFVGVGTGGAGGSATTIMAIGGKGAFADLTSAQTVAGVKTFSSSPVVPTVASNDNSTNVASTAFVKAQSYLVSADLSSYLTSSIAASTYAPLASPTFTGTVTIPSGASISGYLTTSTASSTYAPLASPSLTGTPLSTTASVDTNTTQIATTAYVVGQGYLKSATASTTYAPLASPTFTGTVTIPSGASISGYLTTSTADTTYAPLASPTLTGTPLSTTAAVSTNTTQIATTAFVLGQGNSTAGTIAMNGSQAAGTSNLYARADHVHPTDTTLAPLASPTLTGTPLSTTAAVDTNTTQIATTAYVVGQGYLKSSTASTTYAPLASPTFTGTVTIPSGASISGFAPLASPTFTGTPLSTTATAGTNTTQIATTAFVSTAVSNLVASAPEALNTLNELALALGSDASFSTTIATSIGTKLTTANNLSELTATASTARTNLGLGSMATQASSNVSITGGTIDGLTFDGGSF